MVTRIFSDLHYRDPASWVEKLSSLEPLFEGADHLVLNGDSLDSQTPENAVELLAEVRAFFANHSIPSTLITGNHDPDISPLHEISLVDGRVWVTHGDVFFDDVAPWGHEMEEIRRRFSVYSQSYSKEQMRNLETRYAVIRKVCLKLPPHHKVRGQGPFARFRRLVHAVTPPTRILTMLKAWRELPTRVGSYAAEQRPKAELIITGHTHFYGFWTLPDGRHVINTGSFCPPRGGQVVDVSADLVRIRRVDRKGNGEFRLGATLAEFPLAPKPLFKVSGSI